MTYIYTYRIACLKCRSRNEFPFPKSLKIAVAVGAGGYVKLDFKQTCDFNPEYIF